MHVQAKKSLGQNFLQDEEVIEHILTFAGVSSSDQILEIGPGMGALTEALAETGARVVAIELDRRLIEDLRNKFQEKTNVTIVEGDVLKISLPDVLRENFSLEQGYKIIANIPYYITAPIIRTFLSLEEQPTSMTLMVQDEVAERLTAKPGEMSLLSVMAQYYAAVEKKLFVPKEAFDPVPKVDSAVIHIVPTRTYIPEKDRSIFRLARAGFAARRKTLANNLASSFSLARENVEEKLVSVGLRKDIRAQALSVEDWERLEKVW